MSAINSRHEVTDSSVYLKPTTKLEPLVMRWSAWPHLLAPATLAMNLANRHLTTLSSFVSNPAIHIAAVRDPAMLGGPFLALTLNDVKQIKAMIGELKSRCGKLLAFAEQYKEFNRRIQQEATGTDLSDKYRSLPDALRGAVELVYDINNHPKVKIIEEGLQECLSELRELQEICLHSTPDCDRVFFLTTPLLDDQRKVFARIPFDDPRLQELAAMRIRPRPLSVVCSELGLAEGEWSRLSELVTAQSPLRVRPTYERDQLRVRYFGHACVLVQTADLAVLIDPWTAWERDGDKATFTFDDLPDYIDAVVITHAHADHFVAEMLVQLRGRVGTVVIPRNDAGNIADPSLKLILRRLGFHSIVQADVFDDIKLASDAQLLCLPFSGEHAGLDIATKHCIALRLRGRTLLFFVDSDGFDPSLYRSLKSHLGRVDCVFLGLECHGAPLSWLYGPLFTQSISKKDDESRRLNGSNCERAWSLLEQLDCSRVFVYAMGHEPWLKRVMALTYDPSSVQVIESDKLIERCRAAGIQAERLYGCVEFEC